MKATGLIAAALAACLCFGGCAQRGAEGAVSDGGSVLGESAGISQPAPVLSAAEVPIPEEPAREAAPAASAGGQGAAAAEDPRSAGQALGPFLFQFPEGYVVEGNMVYDGGEQGRQVAELMSAEAADPEDPFLECDERYAAGGTVAMPQFGGHPARSYALQWEVSQGGVTGFQNVIVYCIEVEGRMAEIAFYPARGTGIAEQREAFEEILDTIQLGAEGGTALAGADLEVTALVLAQQLASSVFQMDDLAGSMAAPPDSVAVGRLILSTLLYQDREGYRYRDFFPLGEDRVYHLPVARMDQMASELFGGQEWQIGEQAGLDYDRQAQEFLLPAGFGIGNGLECREPVVQQDGSNRLTVSYTLATSSNFPNSRSLGSCVSRFSILSDSAEGPYLRYQGTDWTPAKEASFTKIQVGVDVGSSYGVFALDSAGQLTFFREDGSQAPVSAGVRDFSATESALYLLKADGNLYTTGETGWQEGGELEALPAMGRELAGVSDSMALLADRTVASYRQEGGWLSVPGLAGVQKLDADYFGAALLDGEGALWYLDREGMALQKVADGVVDCSYTDRSKVYYADDLWYVTQDGALCRWSPQGQAGEDEGLPTGIISVAAYQGSYLALGEDGSYLLGSLESPGQATPTGIGGTQADLFGGRYAILDGEGEIRFGRVQDGSLAESRRISRP